MFITASLLVTFIPSPPKCCQVNRAAAAMDVTEMQC